MIKSNYEKIVDKHFIPLEDKINKLSHSEFLNRITFDTTPKLEKAEIQIFNTIKKYDNLQRMSIEEKYQFAQYLLNLYNKVNNIIDIKRNFTIDKTSVDITIELLQSPDIHNKVIGIDNFMSLAHTNSTLLPELFAIIYDVKNRYNPTDDEYDEQDFKLYLKWLIKIDKKIVIELNHIRNRKGLSRIRYKEM